MAKIFELTVGTKYQVYKGIAEKTAGNLYKKDIVRTTKDGVVRYKSKKQQTNGKKNLKSQKSRKQWTKALKDSISELRKEGKISEENVLMFNPDKTYKNYPKSTKKYKDGVKIYRRVQEKLKK